MDAFDFDGCTDRARAASSFGRYGSVNVVRVPSLLAFGNHTHVGHVSAVARVGLRERVLEAGAALLKEAAVLGGAALGAGEVVRLVQQDDAGNVVLQVILELLDVLRNDSLSFWVEKLFGSGGKLDSSRVFFVTNDGK